MVFAPQPRDRAGDSSRCRPEAAELLHETTSSPGDEMEEVLGSALLSRGVPPVKASIAFFWGGWGAWEH